MATSHSKEKAAFAAAGHAAACKQLYPALFGKNHNVRWFDAAEWRDMPHGPERDKAEVLDKELAVDALAFVQTDDVESRKWPLKLAVQERWREIDKKGYQEFTTTYERKCTRQPGELFKLSGGLFIYGYFDDVSKQIVQAVVVDWTKFQLAFLAGKFLIEKDGKLVDPIQEDKKQDSMFLYVAFEKLHRLGIIIAAYEPVMGLLWRWPSNNAQPVATEQDRSTWQADYENRYGRRK